MKKIILSVLLVLTALTSAMADGQNIPISLDKKPKPKDPAPGIRPYSDTEEDSFLPFEAALTDESVVLTASSATFAQVTIVSESGDVLYDQPEVLGSVPTEISTTGWASGSYTLYITIGDDLYEGFFLL